MGRRVPHLWLVWIGFIWFVSFPWIGLTDVPQWHRIHYVPFSDPADKFRDMIANVLLFLPVGYMMTRQRPPLQGLSRVLLLALCVSISAEAMQLFSTRRHPSATDVAAAILGTLAGAITTLRVRSSSKPSTWTE